MDEDELAEELRTGPQDDGDDPATAEPAPEVERAETSPEGAREPRRAAAPKRGGIPAWAKIGAVFVLLGSGVGLLLWGTDASDAFVYSKLVDEVKREPARYEGRELRVEGQLQRGSVHFDSQPSCEHRFVLARRGHEMPVRFPRCVVPDTFRDDMEMDVVVQGQLQTDGSFLASQVIPRCPSKYEMRQRGQNGEEMPHAPVPPGGETS
jgi:cytochrome c-type biogenesis protein CcmE